jgi:hypothetical protein
MNEPALTAETESLIQGYVEGELTASECARLRELLAASPGLITPVLAHLQADALIRQTVGMTGETLPDRDSVATASTASRKPKGRFRLAAAAVLVGLVALSAMFLGPGKTGRPGRGEVRTGGTGAILYERWDGIPGEAIADFMSHPDFHRNPTVVRMLPDFEAPSQGSQDYGVRVRGYLHPPRTGDYHFWIAADDAGELWLSKDDYPDNKKRICFLETWAPSREWAWHSSQQSRPIHLEEGRRYYIEALHKQGSAGDSLAVAWQPPGATREIIPGRVLSPFTQTNIQAAPKAAVP